MSPSKNPDAASDKKPSAFVKPFSSEPPQRLLVLVEGAVTEKAYLSAFIRKYQLPADRITIHQPKDFSPLGLVKAAVAELAFAPVYRKRHGKPWYDEVWVVFDRDRHTNFDDAAALAEDVKNLFLVPSKPCFELWLLHHFSPRRKAFFGKGKPLGPPVVTQTLQADGNLREEVVTTYAPENPSVLCLQSFEKMSGQNKRLEKAEELVDLQRLRQAMLADFPIADRQDGKECWTLMPQLLLRLLSFRFSAKEVAQTFLRP